MEQLRLELARVTAQLAAASDAQLVESNTRLESFKDLAHQLQGRLDDLDESSPTSPTANTLVDRPTDINEKNTSTSGHDRPSSAARNGPATPTDDESAAAHLPNTGTKPTPLPLGADKTAPGIGSDRARRLRPLLREIERPTEGCHTVNAPLLFPDQGHAGHASRTRKTKTPNAKGKHFIRKSRRSSFALLPTETMMKTRYPMFVLPVRVLLRLERLLPHQDMLEQGLLLPYNQFTMKGRIMFISHQCTYHLCYRVHDVRTLRSVPRFNYTPERLFPCDIRTPPPPGNPFLPPHTPLYFSKPHTYNPDPIPLLLPATPHSLRTSGTGNTNADATGAQLVALQRMLERLMHGKISRVELNWTQQVIFGYSDAVKAATWMAALPHMFVW